MAFHRLLLVHHLTETMFTTLHVKFIWEKRRRCIVDSGIAQRIKYMKTQLTACKRIETMIFLVSLLHKYCLQLQAWTDHDPSNVKSSQHFPFTTLTTHNTGWFPGGAQANTHYKQLEAVWCSKKLQNWENNY